MRQLALSVAFVAVFGSSAAVSTFFGAGSAALLGGIIGVALVVSAFNGSLLADLKLYGVVAPAVVLAVVAPRAIGAPVPWLGAATLAIVIFVACLLPGLGPLYSTVGLSLGLGAIFGYAYPLPEGAGVEQLAISAVAAAAVTAVIRVAGGLLDPRAPLRVALAAMFTAPTLDADETAVRLLAADRPPQWMFDVAAAAFRYQSARATEDLRPGGPTPMRTADLAAGAAKVGQVIRAREPAVPLEHDVVLSDGSGAMLALDTAWSVAVHRAGPNHTADPQLLRVLRGAWVKSLFSWSDPQFRHAVRSFLAVGVALGIALTRPDDPLMVTFLGMTYGIAQPMWRETRRKLARRGIGVVAGGVLLMILTSAVPPQWLAPVGFAALVLGIGFIQRVPAVFYASSAVLTIAARGSSASFDPGALVIEYALLVVTAAVLAVGISGIVIPWQKKPPAAERITRVRLSMVDLIEQSVRVVEQDQMIDSRWARSLRRALAARQALAGDDTAGRVGAARTALSVLDAAVASAITARRPHNPATLRRILRLLSPESSDDPPTTPEPDHVPKRNAATAAVELLLLTEKHVPTRTEG